MDFSHLTNDELLTKVERVLATIQARLLMVTVADDQDKPTKSDRIHRKALPLIEEYDWLELEQRHRGLELTPAQRKREGLSEEQGPEYVRTS